MTRHQFATLLMISTTLIACASQPEHPVPPLDLGAIPPLAAAFTTTRTADTDAHNDAESGTVQWRFFRADQRTETANLSANTAEVWEKDGQTLFMYAVFHADQKAIEYRQDDMTVLGLDRSWQRQQLLIDPARLSQLSESAARWDHGHPVRDYAGMLDGQSVEISWRVDLNLPQRMQRISEHGSELTELTDVYPLADAPWSPTDLRRYQLIDYTDIGDRERDPFVQRVQAQLPGGEVHHH